MVLGEKIRKTLEEKLIPIRVNRFVVIVGLAVVVITGVIFAQIENQGIMSTLHSRIVWGEEPRVSSGYDL